MKDLFLKIGTKNLIRAGIAAIIVIICIVGFSLIYYNFFYRKSFEEIESIMVDAAKQYYSEHQKKLPKVVGESSEVKVSTLVSGDYMKSITDYVKNEDVACKASVKVTNTNNNYRFNPLLDCGRYYKYEYIIDHIKNNEKIVTESDGLYQIDEKLVYRGEKVKNYVRFANATWRIIRIENNKLVLIDSEKIKDVYWDNRYNSDKDSNVGINNYNVSRIRDYLEKLYKGNSLFTDSDKLLLSNYTLQVGKVGEEDDDRSGNLAKSSLLASQYIGLISINDFMNASLDSKCTIADSPNCGNYNYLANYDYNYWTMTADKNSTHKVFKFIFEEGTSLANASSIAYVRPVVAITSDAVYVSGNGTASKPYIFK